MELRTYQPHYARECAQLFYETVHRACAGDYTPAQLDAWAPARRDLALWNQSFLGHDSIIAVEQGRLAAFGDMLPDGYLDRLYVHWAFQRRGIAGALCDCLEWNCAAPLLRVHASRTARPFFEGRGYRLVRAQLVERNGVLLENFVMEKHISPSYTKDRPIA
ncbi:GNAT family N-acetyltransferase [Oscillibacter hominis]|uniref:GNAT family N-acetyltransferase n=1 Tax=Oscillibacter hominis TaxID=2763056 RepID=UPI001FAC900A|nr:GNAT family N-acetyltransferase [Oscillibacter hominis]